MALSCGVDALKVEQPNSLEMLHRRAARGIYTLPRNMPSADVYRHSKWNTLSYLYKLRLIKLFLQGI